MSKKTVFQLNELRADQVNIGNSSINEDVGGSFVIKLDPSLINTDFSIKTNDGVSSGEPIVKFKVDQLGNVSVKSLTEGVVYSNDNGTLSNTRPTAVNNVTSINGKIGDATLTYTDVNALGKSQNLADLQDINAAKLNLGLNYKADLVDGKVPSSQIPSIAISEFIGNYANEGSLLSATGQKGDWAVRSDTDSVWIITGTDTTSIDSWTEFTYPATGVKSFNGLEGHVNVFIPTKISELEDDISIASTTELIALQQQVDEVEALLLTVL